MSIPIRNADRSHVLAGERRRGRRAGAVGITYALAVAIFGGSAQYAATWLIDYTGSPLAPAWYMTGAMVCGVAAMAAMRETAPVKLHAE